MAEQTSTEQTSTEAGESRFAILVTIPTDTPSGPGGDPIRHRIGPIRTSTMANHLIRQYMTQLPGGRVAGTSFEAIPFDANYPHRDPWPPLETTELVELIRDEPAHHGGYDYPDLFARLLAAHGEQGHAAYERALRELDREETAAEEQQTHQAREAERIAPFRALIDRWARRAVGLYTAPVVERAAALLADVTDAGMRYGMQPGDWEVDLRAACLDAVSHHWRGDDALPARRCGELLGIARDRLGALGHPSTTYVHYIELWDVPPGESRPLRLVITSEGWDLQRALPGLSGTAYVFAPPTDEGALAVADVIAEVIRGDRPMPAALSRR